jgi:hypothetical protein
MNRWSTRLREEWTRLAAYARALEHGPKNGEQVSRPFLFRTTMVQLGRTRRLCAACKKLGVGGRTSEKAERAIKLAASVCERVWATEAMRQEWNEQLGDMAREPNLNLDGVGIDPWATVTALCELEDAADEADEFERMDAPQCFLYRILQGDTGLPPVMAALSNLPPKAKGELTLRLQNYRLANLTIRALADTVDGASNAWVQVHNMISMTDTRAAINEVVRALAGEQGDDPELRKFVAGVLETISDVGLEGLKEVAAADTQGGGAAAVGGQPINVLPSFGEECVCAPFVLAIVSGTKGKWGFGSVLSQLTAHLISCLGTSKLVLVVSDVWDGAGFTRDHVANWRAFDGRGVKFAVVQYTGTSLKPIVLPVDLT